MPVPNKNLSLLPEDSILRIKWTLGQKPEKSLTKGHHRKKGRNSYGRITSRRRRRAQKIIQKN